jgi:preprotein translocase subunit SecA
MSALPRPGPRWGAYPQRPDHQPAQRAPQACSLQAWAALPGAMPGAALLRAMAAPLLPWLPARATAWCWRPWLQHTRALSRAPQAQGHADGLTKARARLLSEGLSAGALAEALACVNRAAEQALGHALHDTQLLAAGLMLDHQLVEVATGEGKTLAMACAAAVAALAGMPVHVVTANDYLAQRDAQSLAPLWQALGLRVAHIVPGQQATARRKAYGHDIVYASAKELAFDHLRDCLAMPGGGHEQPVLRGLCLALLDEADSILLDEAVVPLVISASRQATPAQQAQRRALWWQAHQLASGLTPGLHFQLDAHQAKLTPAGRSAIDQMAGALQGLWRRPRTREALIQLALAAQHTLHRDQHYLLRDGRIELLDTLTGRVATGRVWAEGLQALIEIKERCALSAPTDTLAQITFQRFFRRYWRLGGLSGTLMEARNELAQVHGLRVMHLPRRLPSLHQQGPVKVFATPMARWAGVVERARALQRQGRPVLIGTDSVEDSQALSGCLQEAGIVHAVLNAQHDQHEADIVAQAGQAGRVTVSTRMAGRGTDIQLDAAALAAGGLHVIHCQRNESARMDRQLLGRCARQGQPGSSEMWLCTAISKDQAQVPSSNLSDNSSQLESPCSWTSTCIARLRTALAQSLASRRQAAWRQHLMAQDQQWQRLQRSDHRAA